MFNLLFNHSGKTLLCFWILSCIPQSEVCLLLNFFFGFAYTLLVSCNMIIYVPVIFEALWKWIANRVLILLPNVGKYSLTHQGWASFCWINLLSTFYNLQQRNTVEQKQPQHGFRKNATVWPIIIESQYILKHVNSIQGSFQLCKYTNIVFLIFKYLHYCEMYY